MSAELAPALFPAPPKPVWRLTGAQWLLLACAGAAVVAAFLPGLRHMVAQWEGVEEYGYGYFIPLIAMFFVWQKSDQLRQREFRGSWSGLVPICVSLILAMLGTLSAMLHFMQYGFVIALVGLSVCLVGWAGTRIIAAPLAILLLMVPLPQFIMHALSQQLQFISSELGVALIRLAGISVFLEGNVIDLGAFKLQVVEACSGLRYLFPLMVIGVLAAYFFKGALWKRLMIVGSTVPLTIVINSLRIALIGVTVEYWGPTMADGLLHDFEGWFMFMVCIALLIAEMSLLARIGKRTESLRTVFGLDYPEPIARGSRVQRRRVSMPFVAAVAIFFLVAAVVQLAPRREQVRPERTPFAALPMRLDGGWVGRADRLDREVLATLALDDYALTNYARPGEPPVNFYSAYYAAQSSGKSTHSPRNCMPGGGWRITQIKEVVLALSEPTSRATIPLAVNRAVIERGDQKQLVYYWFDERGRTLTNELEVKWFILRDSVVRARSDGALLRLATPVAPNETVAQADLRMSSLLSAINPTLAQHVPR